MRQVPEDVSRMLHAPMRPSLLRFAAAVLIINVGLVLSFHWALSLHDWRRWSYALMAIVFFVFTICMAAHYATCALRCFRMDTASKMIADHLHREAMEAVRQARENPQA